MVFECKLWWMLPGNLPDWQPLENLTFGDTYGLGWRVMPSHASPPPTSTCARKLIRICAAGLGGVHPSRHLVQQR